MSTHDADEDVRNANVRIWVDAGPRGSDGVWAAHWYAAVTASTGFAPPDPEPPPQAGRMRAIAEAARPDCDRLRAHAL
jgi:Sulfotransferase domain